jgi:hypothetical protein
MAAPENTSVDGVYAVVAMVILLVCMVVGMVMGADLSTYVERLLDTDTQQPLGKTLDFVGVFGSMLVGDVIAIAFMAFLSRRYVSSQTFDRWQQQLDQAGTRLPYPHRVLMGFLLRVMRPRTGKQTFTGNIGA